MKETYIGADHAGFKLKEKIKKFLKNYKIKDLGAYKYNKNDDYPDFAKKVSNQVKKNKNQGILICGTGQGMSIAANKIKGIRAALCWNTKTAKQSKKHLNTNILVIPGTLKENLTKKIVTTWLNTKFTKEKRHIRRINKIK